MASRVPWSEDEAILLVDAFQMQQADLISRTELVNGISWLLKNKAIQNKVEVDEVYRNKNGISMRYEEIRRLFNNGQGGLQNTSRLFINTVALYRENHAEFQAKLRQIGGGIDLRIPWTNEESALLLNAYLDMKSGKITEAKAASQVSEQVRKMAVNKGLIVDDKYRSINGIEMCLGRIDYLFSGGSHGLENNNPIYSYVIALYRNNPSEWRVLLNKALSMVSPTPAEHKLVIDDALQNNMPFSYVLRDHLDESAIPLSERYHLPVENYNDVEIVDNMFSRRVMNRLDRRKILSVAQLLLMSDDDFMSMDGFGANSLVEIHKFCSLLSDGHHRVIKEKPASQPSTSNSSSDKESWLTPYADDIFCGNFSFISELDHQRKLEAEQVQQAYDLLGEELVFTCYETPELIGNCIRILNSISVSLSQQAKLTQLIDALPNYRRKKKAKYYINAFTSKNDERETLYTLLVSEESTISELSHIHSVFPQKPFELLQKFLQWCSFDLSFEVSTLLDSILAKDSYRTVLRERSNGHTLEQTGECLHVTRERVRQIESKIAIRFHDSVRKKKIFEKIQAELDGAVVISPDDIATVLLCYAEETCYLLSILDSSQYIFDKANDCFVVGETSIYDDIQEYIESLPDVIRASEVDSILSKDATSKGMPIQYVEKCFYATFKQTGDVFHKSRLSLGEMYSTVMERAFPMGINVYDHDDLNRFRESIREYFGDVRIPEDDRPLTVRLSNICILCGRGRYKAKQRKYISSNLSKAIMHYIQSAEQPMLMTNVLYAEFEDQLKQEGVDNKYYLQGILREIFDGKLFFKRDYVSREKEAPSFYTAIVNYIKKSAYPVSKAQIQAAFPGITEIVVNFATSDHDVLNFFGNYLHVDRLQLNNDEKEYLYALLTRILSDNKAHHVADVYDTTVPQVVVPSIGAKTRHITVETLANLENPRLSGIILL